MRFPTLYQVNTRFWLSDLSDDLGRQAGLDDIPDNELDRLQKLGFDWLYLICVWETGEAEAELARSQPWLHEKAALYLGNETNRSLCSSCFAISGYKVPDVWGGQPSLKRLKKRLNQRGMRLMLDFIPNHTGISHSWAKEHPDYFVQGDESAFLAYPSAYIKLETASGERIIAHGRDPYFPPWTDTLQLNYANPDLQNIVITLLMQLTEVCDGLRCDMSMLILPQVFEQTWGLKMPPFWSHAITEVKEKSSEFIFLAEIYWNLESEMLDQGFDYAYDKQLYDRLVDRKPEGVRSQIQDEAGQIFRQTHFLENHDEARAAEVFPLGCHQAASLITYLLPGMRFFFSGQLEGHRIRAPLQFCTSPIQKSDPDLSKFYSRLLEVLKHQSIQETKWQLLDAQPAWDSNVSWNNLIGTSWLDDEGICWVAVVNFSQKDSQCYYWLPFLQFQDNALKLYDLLNNVQYDRKLSELSERGLFINLPAWGAHLFKIVSVSTWL